MSAKTNFMPSRWSKILTGILIGLLVLGLIGLAVFLLRPDEPKKDGYTDFTVLYEGKPIEAESDMTLYTDQSYAFKVRYEYEGGEEPEEPFDFKVDILPHTTEGTDFEYTVEGEKHKFSDIESLLSLFTVTQDTDSFTIKAPSSCEMYDLICALYPDKSVSVPDSADGKLFCLVISSHDEAVTYKVVFDIFQTIPVESITLDKEVIEW